MKSVRKVINEIMNDVLIKEENLSSSFDKRVKESGIKGNDIGLAKEEVFGTIRNLIKINYVIHKYNNIKKVDMDILNLLRTSVYEILFLDKIPEHATCNEAVNLTKQLKRKSAANFVNAVLRNVTRCKGVIEYPKKEDGDIVEYLSVNYSMPVWIVEMFLDIYDVNELERMFTVMNSESDITLLTNTLYTTPEKLTAELRAQGLDVAPGRYIKDSLRLRTMPNIAKLNAFKQGYFYMQDESSMIAARTLNPLSGEKVLDVCASPGGKSIYMTIMSGDTLRINARDKSNDKVKLIKDNIKRLKLSSIKAKVFDATKFDNTEEEFYDKLILDVPCSGLGLLSKKPDIRYHSSPDDIEELIALQRLIFDTSIKYLKRGGELIYTTCTLNKEENEKNLEYFLNSDKYKVEMVSIESMLPEGINENGKGYVTLLPHIHGTDGFFISKMKKVW